LDLAKNIKNNKHNFKPARKKAIATLSLALGVAMTIGEPQ
jgi:hypothetical protein